MTTQFLRNTNTDGCGDGFWQECNIGCMVEVEHQSQKKYRAETCQDTRQDTNEHSTVILLQQFYLLIKRNCQTDGSWGKQITDDIGTRIVSLIIYSRNQQGTNNQNDGNQQRIHQRPSCFNLQKQSDGVSSQTDQNTKKDRILKQGNHFFASFPLLITN